jgi:hypothetical protein
MGTPKKREKMNKKDCQLVVRIKREVRDEFITLCEELDTTAAREMRKFINSFIKKNS